MHKSCHAYICIFVQSSSSYLRDSIWVFGLTGHATVFQTLVEWIAFVLRTEGALDLDLDQLYKGGTKQEKNARRSITGHKQWLLYETLGMSGLEVRIDLFGNSRSIRKRPWYTETRSMPSTEISNHRARIRDSVGREPQRWQGCDGPLSLKNGEDENCIRPRGGTISYRAWLASMASKHTVQGVSLPTFYPIAPTNKEGTHHILQYPRNPSLLPSRCPTVGMRQFPYSNSIEEKATHRNSATTRSFSRKLLRGFLRPYTIYDMKFWLPPTLLPTLIKAKKKECTKLESPRRKNPLREPKESAIDNLHRKETVRQKPPNNIRTSTKYEEIYWRYPFSISFKK